MSLWKEVQYPQYLGRVSVSQWVSLSLDLSGLSLIPGSAIHPIAKYLAQSKCSVNDKSKIKSELNKEDIKIRSHYPHHALSYSTF